MRPSAPGAGHSDIPCADEAGLRLRLELLRSRRRLDEMAARMGHPQDPGAALGALVEDSRELALLKASRRYQLASFLADSVARARGLASVAGRPAAGFLRSLRTGLGTLRRRARGESGTVAPRAGEVPVGEAQVHPLPGPDGGPASAKGLRIAAILDPFSAASFAPECTLQLLTPDDWIAQLRAHRPHLLLVESAWTGMDGEWAGQVERAPALLRSLVASCRAAGIPTVFWNKEDPLHFGAFLETARLFDHVMTTDADSVPRYRRLLGHDRVGVMPFGIQPAIHHPIGDGARRASSVFAGAWYGRLPGRCRDFSRSADALALAGDLVIHDRHNGQGEAHQRFPARYRGYLRPAVSFEATAAVFRSHVIGLNLNTIKASPTMFARRALELAACGTSVYGNHSVALHGILGDAAVISDDGERLLTAAWHELRQPRATRYRHRRLQALRKVMREHTWARRVGFLARRVANVGLDTSPGRIIVVARARDEAALERVGEAFLRQSVPGAELIIDAPAALALPPFATRLSGARAGGEAWVAPFHDADYYGPHYLSDLVDAIAWQAGDILGKAAWHAWDGTELAERHPEKEYCRVESLALRRAMFRLQAAGGDLGAVLDALDSGALAGRCVSTDAWEYVEGGATAARSKEVSVRCLATPRVEDAEAAVERLPRQADAASVSGQAIDGPALAGMFSSGLAPGRVSCVARRGRMELCSLLAPHETATIYTHALPLARFQQDGRVRVTLQSPRLMAVRAYLEVLGARGQVLQRARMYPSLPADVDPVPAARSCRVAIEVDGPVVQEIDGVWIGCGPARPLFVPGAGRLALVTNAYPKADDLYRNGFVHRRVVGYRERGVGVDVFVVRQGLPSREYEFEGVLVRECDPGTLAATLEISGHAAIAVHVLDRALWQALEGVRGRQPITVWMHGAEVQSWRHRDFNFDTEVEREAARRASEERSAFWNEVLGTHWPGVRYVLVSSFFARQTWVDLGVQPPEGTWSVIHNPVDTRLFNYRPKTAEMARRILSIRPHASRIYANDLVARTIQVLARHELFPMLSFTLVGDGELWEDNFAGLEQYPNVRLVRGFLPQRDIARLHGEHGVFLVPTRGDTQGVSRDEAMSSGLVPVTSAVGAVPEFVDESCAELCPAEDPYAMAEAILALATDAARFQEKSRKASERVASQSAAAHVVDQEIAALRLAQGSLPGCCASPFPPHRIY